MSSLKLYSAPHTRANRPHWALEELGVPYELVNLDLSQAQHKTPEYLKVHPLGVVPALSDGDLTMFESVAICMYLADKYADKKLAPPLDSPLRGRYYQWMLFFAATLEPVVGTLFLHTVRLPPEQRIPAVAEAARAQLAPLLKIIEATLSQHDYLLGSEFCMADVIMGTGLMWAKSLGWLNEHPVLLAYVARLSQRPALHRTRQ